MTRLVDGLLNPHDDLPLLSLAIRDASTHALFLQNALLRPPTHSLSTFHMNHPAPSNLPQSSVATALADITAAKLHLFVPHLRLPWAATLADLMLRRLNVRLVPCTHHVSPNPHLYDHFLDVLNTADTASEAWNNALLHFYPPLSQADTQYNAIILQHIHATYGPLAIEKITTCVRLAFVNSLLLSLQRSRTDCTSETTDIHNRQLETTLATRIKDISFNHHARSRPATPILPPRPQPSRAKRVQSARTLDNPNPVCQRNPTHCAHRLQKPDLLSPQRSRTTAANSSIVLRGYPIPDVSSSNANKSPSFLIHGVVICGRLLSTMTKLLAERYAVYLYIEDQVMRPPERAGSLASLSNFGTALLRRPRAPALSADWYSPPQHHHWHSCSGVRLGEARGPSAVKESVDKYLMDKFGLRWSSVCAAVVEEATEIVESKRLLQLAEQIHYLDDAIRIAESIRRTLIRRASDYEAAGTSLSRMCAFAIARYMPCSQVERQLEYFSPEYTQLIQEARCRIQQLEASDSVCAGELVGDVERL